MTETPTPSGQSPPPPPPSAAPAPPAAAPPPPPATAPPLLRSRQNRVVAGVAAGVAYRLGIDPTLVRVIVVVLSLFGGAGILLYALGWLLLPEEGTGRSLADQVLRGDASAQTVLLAVGLAFVAVVIGFGILRETWIGISLLAVTVVAAVLLLSRRPAAPLPGGPLPVGAPPAAARPAGTGEPSASGDYPYGAGDAGGYDPGYADSGPYQPYQPYEPYEQQPAREPRPRSILGPLTFFAALITLGVVGVVDGLGASVPASAYLAAPLAVVGLGLVVGAWFGRSRGLIALGVVLVALLVPTAALQRAAPFEGFEPGFGQAFDESTFAPTSARELDGHLGEHGAGDIVYDLTAVDFTDRTVDLAVRVGAGSLDVVVPQEVQVELDAQVGVGQVEAFGTEVGGLGVQRTQTYAGQPDGGTLRLDIEMGFGNVEVTRADA